MMEVFAVVGFLYIFVSFYIGSAQKSCSSNYMNISQICVPGHTSGEMVMLDFSPFETSGAPSCDCSVYVTSGNRLEFNYVFSPGYYGCGSVITINHRTTSTIRCLQGAESLTVTPGDSVTVQIFRERETFDSKYCYLLRSYQVSGLERIPGSIIVVCNHPSLPSTTVQTTIVTEHPPAVTTTTTTTTNIVSSQTEDDLSSTGIHNGFTINTINFTGTALITKSEDKEVSTSYNYTGTTVTETQHIENRQLAHFPWEIITPLSIIIFVLIVVAVIILKVRRSRYLKSTYIPAESRATSWAFNQPSLNVSSPKKPSSLKTNVEKTDSGVYSTLGENDKRSTESVHKAAEKYYREVSIDQAIVENEAKTQREQRKEGLDNAGFVEGEVDCNVERSKDIPSGGSSESDISNFISKMYVTDTENQNYFLEYKDKTTCNSKEGNDSHANSVVSEQVPQTSEKQLQEEHPQLPIDTGYVIIDVLASI
ncbi:uncharacterized protein LOC133185948 [Saccostrea echinata]|uniref:uncharacterized protein LOC133185948 n=1 Tax=Saccostrea echinata TaxID=191078 RepID=UPI002A83DE9A|nr:uncharacterized protein LOC133185948 [Saccostrea echinata]